ncbi:MAG: hypothetical protein IT285_08300, partial [Bdellovibrionales bacterium]|nr:hypothetical protein [Bdellovibrionales bacterium]
MTHSTKPGRNPARDRGFRKVASDRPMSPRAGSDGEARKGRGGQPAGAASKGVENSSATSKLPLDSLVCGETSAAASPARIKFDEKLGHIFERNRATLPGLMKAEPPEGWRQSVAKLDPSSVTPVPLEAPLEEPPEGWEQLPPYLAYGLVQLKKAHLTRLLEGNPSRELEIEDERLGFTLSPAVSRTLQGANEHGLPGA